MGIGTFTVAELSAHGVTATIALERTPKNRLQYVVTAKRFRAVLPYCGCDRKACAGPGIWGRVCKESNYTHSRDHCHGNGEGSHEEHALVYAAAVLATFGPKGKYKLPAVRKSTYPRNWSIFLPLDGEHAVVIVPWAHYDKWRVTCDAARCRDAQGHVVELTDTTDKDEAYRIRNEHIEWHRSLGVHPRVALDQWIAEHAMVSTPEPEAVPA